MFSYLKGTEAGSRFRPLLIFLFVYHQIQKASDEQILRKVCVEQVDMTLEAGYTLAVTSIGMGGKSELLRTLMLHHTLL